MYSLRLLLKRDVKQLRKVSSFFVREDFVQKLITAIEHYGLGGLCIVEAEPDGNGDSTYPEPHKIYVKYKSLSLSRCHICLRLCNAGDWSEVFARISYTDTYWQYGKGTVPDNTDHSVRQ